MVDPFDKDRPRERVEDSDQAIVSDSKFAFVGPDRPFEESVRVHGGLLELPNDALGNGAVNPTQVTSSCLGPVNRPGLQRPNRRLSSSCLTTRPARMSRRALSSPTRNAAV